MLVRSVAAGRRAPTAAGAGQRRVGRASSLRVRAIQSKGKTPEQPELPDPFDRHSSARDKAPQERLQGPSYRSSSSIFAASNRRKGRPAHLRSPDDSPLRDGNRDRLIGLLTERAARTLLVYLQETNPTVYHWLFCWIKENPIPVTGTWDEISGEMFLRKMLSTPAETAKIELGRGELFDNIASVGVDPRQMAQRIMEIRVQLSKEFAQDLLLISDENSVLLRETLQVSLANTLNKDPIQQLPPRDLSNVFVHPELLSQDGSLHPEVASSHPELLPVVEQQADRLRPTPPVDAASSTTTATSPSPSPQPSSAPLPTSSPSSASGQLQPSSPPRASPSIARGGAGGGGGGLRGGPAVGPAAGLPPMASRGFSTPSPAGSRGGTRGSPARSMSPSAASSSASAASSSPSPPPSARSPQARRPPPLAASGGGGGGAVPHAVNMQPPTRRSTGPWKFSDLKKQHQQHQQHQQQRPGGAAVDKPEAGGSGDGAAQDGKPPAGPGSA